MERVRFVLILAYSIVFLVAVGVATMLIVTEWQDTPTPAAEVTEAPTAAPTEPRATLTPGMTPITPQPTRTPRPTTTPAPTTVALAADDAITAANAAGLVQRGAIALEGAPDAQNTIRSFAWSPNGEIIAVPEPANNRVALYDAETEELIATLAEQNEPVRSVAFSPDGALLAVGARAITVWDVESGEQIASLEGHDSPALSLAFSPDGARIASTSADGIVRVWDAITGDEQRQLALGAAGQGVAFSPDGAILAARSERIVRLWDAEAGEELATLEHGGLVNGMAFAPDGARLTTASLEGAVQVWDVETGEVVATLREADADAQPLDVAYSANGDVLAVGSLVDAVIFLLDAGSGSLLASLDADPAHFALRFSPDGRQLAALSGQRGDTLLLWGLPD